MQIANRSHLNEILTIERELFDQPWSEVHFEEELEKIPVSKSWVLCENNKVIGFIFGWMIENEFHLNNIAIKKQFQGKGLGLKLINSVIEFVKSKKGNLIFLEVMHDNESAIRLYEKNGFESVGKRKDYYTKGKHAILYTLEINNG
ncbi:MAG: ribosomal protein S18-alanine N-acetyltransferase [Candidatus Marinimicrobia bacterium]|nr:ribosomal protein S18-alanine N-acetyltransferase [Candidatus Neomarinimicrobiota bacterium]